MQFRCWINIAILAFFLFLWIPCYAQPTGQDAGLRYEAGIKRNIYRTGYWDSLAKDAATQNDLCTEVKALGRLGYCLHLRGLTDDALSCYKKSIEKAKKTDCNSELLPAYLHIAHLYFIQNNIEAALEYYYKGMLVPDQFKSQRQRTSGKILLGHIYLRFAETDVALMLHFKCLDTAVKYGFHEEEIQALLGIGNDYRELGNFEKAIEYYFKTGKYTNEFKGSVTGAQIYNALGAGYDMQKMFDSAGYYYHQSHNASKQIDNRAAMAGSLVLIARNNFNFKKYELARKQALEALDLVNAMKFYEQIPTLAMLLKEIYEQRRDYKTALKYHELYVSVHDSVTNEKIKKDASERQYQYVYDREIDKNKLLTQTNDMQALQLNQARYFKTGAAIFVLLILIVGLLFIRQDRARTKQHEMQLEQKLLRSQMNPHFIFNSLQAIQNFVLKQDGIMTAKYLSTFATLARHVLESSRMEYITLGKEVSLLGSYLQLQKLRFGDRFNYCIDLDQAINPESVTIPPMLCQPFIENAVEHGMKDIQHSGMITIAYRLINKALEVEITDNGAGIDPVDVSAQKHRSLAIDITKERIGLINRAKKSKITFEISDAFPGQKYKGVKVLFSFFEKKHV
jgi:tetratricopeptide (TPR) repeat protein